MMRRVSLVLLGALGIAYGKCGLLSPLLGSYQYGSRVIAPVSAPNGNATGICAFLSPISMHEFIFTLNNIDAKFEAKGLDVSKIVMVGSEINMASITSGQSNAYGVYGSENITLTVIPNYAIWGKTKSSLSAQSISAKNNAYGIYATKNLNISGSGKISSESITSQTGIANGLYAKNLELEKSNIYFKSITSSKSAVGISAYSIRTKEESVISIDLISATNNAYGMKIESNFYMGNFSLNAGKITSSTGTAIGMALGGKVWHNYYESSFNNSSSLNFGEISGVNAVGVYTSGNGSIGLDFKEENVSLKFEKITASSGDAVGFYNNKASGVLYLAGDVLDFGSISSAQGNAYGIYTTDSRMDIKLSDSTLSLSLQGKDTQAFKSVNKGSIDIGIYNSTLNLNGNGGKIDNLYASGSNIIDISGYSHNALQSRTSTRTLSIHRLDSNSYISQSNLTFRLYHAPDKGIADNITIDSLRGYQGGIHLDVFYEPSAKSKASQYSLLLKSSDKSLRVNGIDSSGEVGMSILQEGIEEVATLIHRYDDSNTTYYYLDTQEKQRRSLNGNAYGPLQHILDANLGSYFLSINTLNKRMGDLKNGLDNSGLWGNISFGGVDGVFSDIENINIQIGGDYQKEQNEKTYFAGIVGGYSPTLLNSEAISNFNHYEIGLYGGIYAQSGWFYYAQLKADFFQATLSSTPYLQEGDFSQWGFSFSNEIGYRLSFGERGGFFLEPKAMVSIGALLPTKYQQDTTDLRRLNGDVKAFFALDSQIGGRLGYAFLGGWDMYFGAYYSYKGLQGGNWSIEAMGSNGEMLQTQWQDDALHSFSSILFDLGSNIAIGSHSKLLFNVDFGFGEFYNTIYKVNASYRFNF